MFDIKLIREDIEKVKNGLRAKNTDLDLDGLLSLDKKRKNLLVKTDDLRAKKNKANDEIGTLIKSKKDAKKKIAEIICQTAKTVIKNIWPYSESSLV